MCTCVMFFFCKQKTSYEMRISDLSSDVCSSDRCLSSVRASIAAFSSIRLLVVANSPPLSVRRVSPYCSTAPQPPGPGLPLQAPSVWIVTVLAMRNESFMSTFYRPCPPRHSEKMILRRHDHSHPDRKSKRLHSRH